MAAKLVQALADDNPDLQKQIGCMNGIFQLFDRQQLVAGRWYGHRRLLLSANPQFSNGGLDREYNGIYLRRHADEPHYFDCPNEGQRFSTESSRASISSSCSSSLSSWECGKSAQPESSPFDRAVFSEAPSFDPVSKQSGFSLPNLGRKSMDLCDVVKDSMYREAGRGSLQVKPKDTRKTEHRDGLLGIDNAPADIKESLKFLAKLQESQWYCNDARQLPRSSSTRDHSSQSLTKDAPRFSYDGGEQMQNRLSFESRDTIKSSMKLNELPRQSFDSRECSFPSLHSTVSSNGVQTSAEKAGGVSNKKRPGVVAKLMGLEALPDHAAANENAPLSSKKPDFAENFSPFVRASRRNEMNGQMRGSSTPGSSMKEPESPCWRNPDGTTRPMPRVPNEPAPWRQADENRILEKPGQKSVKVLEKTGDAIPSLYGEIEKRLKDLEFKQSGKDLRALKQILEAIQAKGLLETRKEGQATNFGSDRNSIPKSRQISRLEMHQLTQGNHSFASTSRGSDGARAFESPIVIIKPSKLVEKDGFVDSSMIPMEDLSNLRRFQGRVHADTQKSSADRRMARDQAHKPTRKDCMATSDRKINSKNVKPNQTPSRSQPIMKENSTLPRNSGSVSPRLQQKKLELERKAHPPTPTSDSNKSKRISNRHTSEAASPGGRIRIKHSCSNSSEDQMSEVSNNSRTPSYQGDDISVHSDSSNFLGSKSDIEVTSQSPSAGSVQFSESKLMPLDVSNPPVDEEDEDFPEFPTTAAEHHSPVSVLDPSAHVEDDPAPPKMMWSSFRESSGHVSSHDHSEDPLDAKMDIKSAPSAREIDRKKLQNIERLVQKLRQVNSTHDEESTDYIASLCENSNPDHRYISEILLASGLLLGDLGSGPATFQMHSSGGAINPELFFVLEQTKSSGTAKEVRTKIHRKLIFDTVNEILTGKLMVMGIPDEPWMKSVGNLTRKTPKAQKLLKELCEEIDMLDAKNPSSLPLSGEDDGLKGILWEDVVRRTGSWTNFCEKSVLVLGIERLIFKDLVNEILVRCGTGSETKPSSRRELFAALSHRS